MDSSLSSKIILNPSDFNLLSMWTREDYSGGTRATGDSIDRSVSIWVHVAGGLEEKERYLARLSTLLDFINLSSVGLENGN